MSTWTRELTDSDLIDRARRMRRYGVPATNPIRAAVRDELFRRDWAALASVTKEVRHA